MLHLFLKDLLGMGGLVLGKATAGCRPHQGSVLGRGHSVSFALPLPGGVLSLCCADPTGAPAVRGSRGSPEGPCRQLPAPALRRLSLSVCLAFPARLHANEGNGGSQLRPLVPCSVDQSPAGTTATAGLWPRDLLLPGEGCAGAGRAMAQRPAALIMA